MRRLQLATGSALLAAATGLLIYRLEIAGNVAPTASELVRRGMTPAEVETVMGRKGEPWFYFMSGDLRYWSQRTHFAEYWDAPKFGVVVYFNGPRGEPVVEHVYRVERRPRNGSDLLPGFCGVHILAVLGLCLIANGVRPRDTPARLNPTPSPDTTDGTP